jgi:hypothetical protein
MVHNVAEIMAVASRVEAVEKLMLRPGPVANIMEVRGQCHTYEG